MDAISGKVESIPEKRAYYIPIRRYKNTGDVYSGSGSYDKVEAESYYTKDADSELFLVTVYI